ncbi:MAG TPA: glutamine-hydrolyzing GMP synthase, partial [Planctomycetota bacterium]|nr:glutamine-hydrolyzing GMP synthase [Planctomycetota bacterium]
MQHELCLVLDFGAQYAQLIARRVRECGVYCRIAPFNITAAKLQELNPRAIILSGGPASVLAEGAPKIDPGLLDLGLPVLGICYGQQLLGQMLGGKVTPAKHREYGHAKLHLDQAKDPLFKGVSKETQVWMSHGDTVTELPKGFAVTAHTATAPMAAFSDLKRKCAGVQFHPEVTHTPEGKKVLDNFLKGYAGFKGDWKMGDFIAESKAAIREKVGKDKVILGLSGGVDSSVAAVLIHEAIAENLQCIFIDNGVLRKNEAIQVEKTFRDAYHIPLKVIDAGQEFLGGLAGVLDPEKKRKIIGEIFVRIFEREAKKVKGAKFLAQGTLYPDVIESVAAHGGPSSVIKSHHNVGGLPAKMNLSLLEPFRELFKDEVRAIGRQLKLPESLVGRQPFPGPGLAVRI